MHPGRENPFVEAREIDGKGKMGEGVPVTVEFMNELVRGYSEHRSNTPYGRILQYAVVRLTQRQREVRLVQSSTEKDDVLQGIAQG